MDRKCLRYSADFHQILFGHLPPRASLSWTRTSYLWVAILVRLHLFWPSTSHTPSSYNSTFLSLLESLLTLRFPAYSYSTSVWILDNANFHSEPCLSEKRRRAELDVSYFVLNAFTLFITLEGSEHQIAHESLNNLALIDEYQF